MTAQQTRLPPKVRRAINIKAHQMALALEPGIRERLEAQARDAAHTPPGELLALLGEPMMTMNDVYAASTTLDREKAWAEFIAGLKPLDNLATWTP